MSEEKSKKRGTRKHLSGGAAPCGHSHCDSRCHVRYVGAVSHPMHHHILHTARGMSHIWSAAVITGLALVLTGAIAYTAVDAETVQREALTRSEYARMMERVQSMEKSLAEMQTICAGRAPTSDTTTTDGSVTVKAQVKKAETKK
ncbi:MAG TPA: hypothetical protein VFQ60_02560 [Patescibacteria group bacterium]|nr:hypothetical protein [Patescibacteria group bacterium]